MDLIAHCSHEKVTLSFRSLQLSLTQTGFSRQALRSETVRTIIGRAPVTELFYHEVAQLTARVSLLFYPLTSYLYQLAPPQGSKIPQVVDLYQALHSLISNAAYLS